MKPAILLALLALPASAQILATFETTRGDVVVELQYDKTPQTVANFITLAQGTRSSYDPATGAVRPKRYYVGESFYRVVNDPGFKIAQTGSGNGTNSGGPGCTFRDEILLPTLKHDPYVLAMANGGPNTNGSQIYLTGSAAIPSLDGKHTVFGLVTDTTSQGVIDAIIAAGNNGTTINNVIIDRTGIEAEAFDEFGQSLPTYSGVPGKLVLTALGAGVTGINYSPAINVTGDSLFRVFKTTDLSSWEFFGQLPPGEPLVSGEPIGFGLLEDPKAFYNISLLRNPNALRQEFLANRTMILFFSGGLTMTLQIGAGETTGYYVLSTNPGQMIPCDVSNFDEAYGATIILNPFPLPRLRVVCGYDSETTTQIIGRHSTSEQSGGDWIPVGSGTLTLSK